MKSENNFLNLQGKVAIITGAATGLGSAVAQTLTAAGVNVLINHMPGQESQAQTVARDSGSNGNNDSLCFAADITNVCCQNSFAGA